MHRDIDIPVDIDDDDIMHAQVKDWCIKLCPAYLQTKCLAMMHSVS